MKQISYYYWTIVFLCSFMTLSAQPIDVAIGDNVTGNFTGIQDNLKFCAAADTYLYLRASSDDITFLNVQIFDPNGIPVPNGSGFSVNVVSLRAILAIEGEYTILVGSQNNNESGTYFLSLENILQPINGNAASCNTTTPDNLNFVTGMIPFYFELEENTTLNIIAETPDFTFIRLELFNANLGEAPVTTSFGVMDTEIQETLPAGVYTLFVMSQNGNESGGFNLILNVINGQCLNIGPIAEICGNGIDDDNDGLIDCEDGDCCNTPSVQGAMVSSNSPVEEGQNLEISSSADNGNAYEWTGPNNFSSTEQNPIINNISSVNEGTYCVTITNEFGCTQENCLEVIVTPSNPSNSVVITIAEDSGIMNDTISLPIYLEGCSSLASFQGTLVLGNPSIGSIIGLEMGQITVNLFNPDNGAFSFFNTDPNLSINEDEPLFYIVIVLTGSPGDMSDVLLNDNATSVELSCIENGVQTLVEDFDVQIGKVSILDTFTISGTIVDCQDQAVWESNISATYFDNGGNSVVQNFETAQSNNFTFNTIPANSEVFIDGEKNDNFSNGISTFWLYAIQQLILGNSSPLITCPCQIVAADVDKSNSVTVADLLTIQQLIVGIIDTFPNSPSWIYLPSDHAFPSPFDLNNLFPYPEGVVIEPVNQDTNIQLTAIKMGDIGKQANPQEFLEAETRNAFRLQLKSSKGKYKSGEMIEFYLTPSSSTQLLSMQSELLFNKNEIELIDWETYLPNLLVHQKGQSNKIRFGWFSRKAEGEVFNTDQRLIKLRFRSKTDIHQGNSLLVISPIGFQSEVMHQNYEKSTIELIQVKSSFFEASMSQNTPNPFSQISTIQFYAPEDLKGHFYLTDIHGKRLFQRIIQLNKGENTIEINANDLPSGLYSYTIQTGQKAYSKKMIIQD